MKHFIFTALMILGTSFFAQASNLLAPPDTIRTAIKKSNVKQYCVDTTEFQGNMVSIENICPASSGTFVNMVVIPTSYCLSFGGLDIGLEKACLKYCDEQGVCDTTIVEVLVVPDSVSTLHPIAVDDIAMAHENEIVTVDILDNDVLPNNGAFTSLKILLSPEKGTVSIDNEAILSYTPDAGFCGAMDTLQYEVCNIAGCDTASVVFDVVPCVAFEGIHIFDGFSPNDDGINDTWRILGLEDFPDHHLLVFNRWGNSVLDTKDYQNNWDGTWEEKALPTGTYFYILNDGIENKYTGSVQIGY